MKLSLIMIIIVAIIAIPSQVYGYNSLENTELHGSSVIITLDIKFGYDNIRPLFVKTIITPQIDDVTLRFYEDEIDMSNSYLKVYGDGRLFSIKNIEQGIVMYGIQNTELNNYKINIYIATNNGLKKFVVNSDILLPVKKTIITQEPEKKQKYIPELLIDFSHDYRTYWKDTFNIDVQTYDGKINPDAKGFEGRLDNANVTVIISHEDTNLKLSGVTANGNWDGEYFFMENISKPGEYVVDVLVSYLNQTVSKSSTMFIIGVVAGGDSSNHTPIANAGSDDSIIHPDTLILDGTGSTDPDGDTITYSWSIQSGLGSLSNENTSTPTYTTAGSTTAIIQLTVTDSKGKSSTDTMIITVT